MAGVAAVVAALAASLQVGSMQPFIVIGRHFAPRERVVVTLSATSGRLVRTVRAGAAGGFRVGFGTVPLDRCSGFVVRAVGAAGGVAVLRHLPPTGCPPP